MVIDAGAAHANLLGEPNHGAAFFLKVVQDYFSDVDVGKFGLGLCRVFHFFVFPFLTSLGESVSFIKGKTMCARTQKTWSLLLSIVFEVSPNTLSQIQSKAHVKNVGALLCIPCDMIFWRIFKNKEQSYTLLSYVLIFK